MNIHIYAYANIHFFLPATRIMNSILFSSHYKFSIEIFKYRILKSWDESKKM